MKTNSFEAALSVGITLLLGLPLEAQQRTVSPTLDVTNGARGLQVEDGYLIGGGAGFRVVLDHNGMELTPALGAHAPQNMPWRFTLESIRRGDQLVHEATRTVDPVRDREFSAVYRRGGGVVEQYDVLAQGVEQSFTFKDPLPGRGDLVVRGRVTTELATGSRGESVEGFSFESKWGHVVIGGVTGIDASGDRSTGSLRFDGDHLDLVLPAAFVEQAEYPLVLDPLIGTRFPVANRANNERETDSAYDASTGVHLVAFTTVFSSGNVAMRAQRFDRNGVRIGGVLFLAAFQVNRAPTVANVNMHDRFLVAWQRAQSRFDQNFIICMGVNPDGALSNAAPIANFDDDIEPDAANATVATDQNVKIVWTARDAGIRGKSVQLGAGNTDPIPDPAAAIVISTDAMDREPAISKRSSTTLQHCVTWHRDRSVGHAIVARAVSIDVAPVGPEQVVFDAAGSSHFHPDVASDGTDFVVVWEHYFGVATPGISSRRMRFDGASIVHDGPRMTVANGGALVERHPAIGFTGTKFLVAWMSSFGFLGDDIRGVALDANNCVACGPSFTLPGARNYDSMPRIGTRFDSGADSSVALLTFTSSDNTPPFHGEVSAQFFDALGGGTVNTVRPGCGGGGTCSIDGAFAFTNTVDVNLVAADAGANLAALHIGSDASPILPCGPCFLLSPFLATSVPISGGNASLALRLDCSPVLLGSSFRFQFVVSNTLSTPCLGLPIGLSNVENAVFDF